MKIFSIILIMIIFIFSGCDNSSKDTDNLDADAGIVFDDADNVTDEDLSLSFGDEEEITVENYTGDLMEPYISADGSILFFNSLNDGVDTSIYYAVKSGENRFISQGRLEGVNGVEPHLDAVSTMSDDNTFYFISTRNYTNSYDNVYSGKYENGKVSGLEAVKGDFYIETPGWIVMDVEISRDGKNLYYVNAYFKESGIVSSKLGIATKDGENNSFTKLSNSDEILQNINDSDYLVYAAGISRDGLELYFTRVNLVKTAVEICVAERTTPTGIFSEPKVIDINGDMFEAVTISGDMSRIYYHKKASASDKFRIYTKSREKK